MQKNYPLFVLLSLILTFFIGCSRTTPLIPDENSPAVMQANFTGKLVARYNDHSKKVAIGAPSNFSKPHSGIVVSIPGEVPITTHSLSDGSFILRFPGESDMSIRVDWTDSNGESQSETVAVSDPYDDLDVNLKPAGIYPNRMENVGGTIWVVNSGDNEIRPYDANNLLPTGNRINAPALSNPWEAAFDGSKGIFTTLFNGAYYFNLLTGDVMPIVTTGFREFASPNGCAIDNDRAWVVNPNPISYFPSEFGQGWVSLIAFGSFPRVNGEIDTVWLNPQFVVYRNGFLYVSCTGTVDFVPPDYYAEALTEGGIHVIDPGTLQIVDSYNLGLGAPGPMGFSPDGRYLYAASSVAGRIFRIDLAEKKILNGYDNPIVIDDKLGTYVPFITVTPQGLLVCASFNSDTIHFLDSRTGELNPFPFFKPIDLSPELTPSPFTGATWPHFYGPQDAVYAERKGKKGILILTTVESGFSWIEL